jgi:hypothetical protein
MAATAKVRVGPTVDFEGNATAQADLSFGFGYALSTDAAITGSIGVGPSSDNSVELTDTIEYHRFEDEYGWRAGLRADIGLTGDKTSGIWGHGALLYPIKKSRSFGGSGKGFHHSRKSRWSVGFESRLGLISRDVGGGGDKQQEGAFGAAATLEWTALSRMR